MVDQLSASVGSEARQRYLHLLTFCCILDSFPSLFVSCAEGIFLLFLLAHLIPGSYGVKTPAPSAHLHLPASLLARIIAPLFEQYNSFFESRRVITINCDGKPAPESCHYHSD